MNLPKVLHDMFWTVVANSQNLSQLKNNEVITFTPLIRDYYHFIINVYCLKTLEIIYLVI